MPVREGGAVEPVAKAELKVASVEGVSDERRLAEVATDPAVTSAYLVNTFTKGTMGSTDLTELVAVVRASGTKVQDGDLGDVEVMLVAQATALNAMFVELARRGAMNMGEYMEAAERYLRLALKAQAQCRATLETLATIKNPPVVYARQANIANGPQQVNNGVTASPATDRAGRPNELLETEHGKRLDPGAADAAVDGDPTVEAVGAIHRAADVKREGSRQPQRRQGRKAASSQG